MERWESVNGRYEFNKASLKKGLDNVAFHSTDKLVRNSYRLTDEVEMARIRSFPAENLGIVMNHRIFQSITGYV